jgi:hypothetical protein
MLAKVSKSKYIFFPNYGESYNIGLTKIEKKVVGTSNLP